MPRLDYCNNALYGLPSNLIRRFQSVQNAAARLIFGIRRSKHITPALISLHWLRVPERSSFKLSVLTYRAIHGAVVRDISSPASLALQACRQDDCVHLILIASTRTARPSLYSRQSLVSSFRRCSMERSAGPCHICAVACDLQTATQDISVLVLLS